MKNTTPMAVVKRRIGVSILAIVLVLSIFNWRWIAYVAHLVRHQAKVILYKEKIADRLAHGGLAPDERQALEATLKIRAFVEKAYGLKSSKSYRYYYNLNREHLGYNITVAPALSLKPESFSFWPIGSFEYLGFFDAKLAEKWADAYRQKGFDVHLAEIGGYSTLGWFEDPLYSSQLSWGQAGLARLLGHEIAHERLYFKDDTAFSELLAAFIEHKIARDYFIAANIPLSTNAQIAERVRRQHELNELIANLRKNLADVYASTVDNSAKLARKRELISTLRQDLERRLQYFNLKHVPELNNASLAQFHRYRPDGQAFEALFQRCQNADREKTYTCWFTALEKLKDLTRGERKQWLEKPA